MRKKVVIKIVFILALLGVIIFLLPKCIYALMEVTIIGDEKYEQTIYEDYFENGCRASILGYEIKDIQVTDNINKNELGDYEVNYTAVFGPISKTVTRIVSIVDDVKPEIVLEGNTEQFLLLNEEYVEQGYSAYDNYDQDLTASVVIDGTVDSTKEGIYELVYSVTDSSGNTRSVTRAVEVKDNKVLSASPAEFWLDGIYPEVILKPSETKMDYFDKVVLIGDSNTWFMYKYSHLIKAEQCWGKANLNIAEINSSTFTTFIDNKKRTLKESIELFKPEYLIISPGIGSPLFMNDTKRYVSELKKLIEYLRGEHPEICFVFTAIMPVNDGQLSKAFQKRINIYNYYLAEICHNYKVNLVNYADVIRGKDGYGLKSKLIYTSNQDDNGFHLTKAAQAEYIDYLKHLDLRRVIE